MCPVAELLEEEPVLQHGVDRAEVAELREEAARLGRDVEVVLPVPGVLAADECLLEREVEVLVRAERVASVALPG